MFKKNISIQNSKALSGKDVKKLKKDIQIQYPDLSEEHLNELIPGKADMTVHKLSNKTLAYSRTGGNPLFFDLEGRGDMLLPTVYTCWLVPAIVPTLFTYSEVSKKVETPPPLQGISCFFFNLVPLHSGMQLTNLHHG